MSKTRTHLREVALFPLLALVYIYKYLISPVMPGGCRHYPTCSVYAIDALKMHGPARGSLLAAKRILRCHPWGTHGIDPVPAFFFKKTKLRKYGITAKNQHPSCDRLKH